MPTGAANTALLLGCVWLACRNAARSGEAAPTEPAIAPAPGADPLAFLWPPPALELNVLPSGAWPARLEVRASQYVPNVHGDLLVQIDTSRPMRLDAGDGVATVDLRGLTDGAHLARGWVGSADGARVAEASAAFVAGGRARPATSTSAAMASEAPSPRPDAPPLPPFVLDAAAVVGSAVASDLDHPVADPAHTVGMHAAIVGLNGTAGGAQARHLLLVRATNDTSSLERGANGAWRRRGAARTADAASSVVSYAYLDGRFGPVGRFRRLRLPTPTSSQLKSGPEDARLVRAAGRLWAVYNDVLPDLPKPTETTDAELGPAQLGRWRMRRGVHVAEIVDDGVGGLAVANTRLLRAPGGGEVEKNWVGWEHNNSLMLSYSIDPHIVLRVPTPADGADAPSGGARGVWLDVAHATRLRRDASDPARRDGAPLLRGGTPAVRLDDARYLAIMHSISRRGSASVYRAAAYTFASRPPFELLEVSPPFALAHLAYPVGIELTKRHVYLSYGVDDVDWAIAKLDRTALLAALVPVSTEPAPADDAPATRKLHFYQGMPAEMRAALGECERAMGQAATTGRGGAPRSPEGSDDAIARHADACARWLATP